MTATPGTAASRSYSFSERVDELRALLLAAPLAGLQALRESAKAVYFTALYMLVVHRDQVAGESEGRLHGRLELGDPESGSSSASGPDPGPAGSPA